VDAFLIADKHIKVFDDKRNSHSLSEACQEITALSKLSDEQVCTFKCWLFRQSPFSNLLGFLQNPRV